VTLISYHVEPAPLAEHYQASGLPVDGALVLAVLLPWRAAGTSISRADTSI
jgi:hypothetical protein